ncbi:hypothetical protein BJ875DRAFT_129502 [Amylocarpus encephaloides]|uniref:Rhodopsin domain-containing protein n=1 Tax=Amylocarpus encephaloides TaxID=45428 RepID=A0A9P8C259_9HELO|nr:hypothetical protein BJ875DRAFT_129502 [Amylocarpus encephaloides]
MSSNAENLQPWSIATVTSVTVLAFLCVCLRLLARYERKQSLWWDDWMILWSMAWNLVVVGFIFGMLKCGMGLHADTVPMENIVLIAKLLVVAEVLYAFNLVWTKLSLLMMYYRIFRFPYFKKWAYIIGAFVIAWVICVTFLFIFICVPVQKLWYPQLPGRCIDQVGTWIANAISTIVSDLATLILPIPQVWKLQLSKPEKIALTAAFGLGFFVIFASAYRFKVLFSYSNLDPTYTLAPTVGWTAIEMSAGIISACLPTLRPAVQLIGRSLGIKGSITGLFRGVNSSSLPTKGTNDLSVGRGLGDGQKGGFYYLPDESKDGEAQRGTDGTLRPKHGAYTVASVEGTSRGRENDEVPLHSISVQKHFEQVSKRENDF